MSAVAVAVPRASRTPLDLSALPRTVRLALYAGDDFAFQLTVTDADGEPTDLAGALIRAQIRTRPDDEALAGEFVIGVEDNVIMLALTSEASTALPRSTVWDCDVTDVDGRVTTLVAGTITMTPQVSR